VIGSLGARRDAESVPALSAMLGDAKKDRAIACAAACALGDIGTPEAAEMLGKWMAKVHDGVREAVVDARLVCAERLSADGKKEAAVQIFYELFVSEQQSPNVRIAAVRGRLMAIDSAEERVSAAIRIITGKITGKDRAMRAIGLEQVREGNPGAEVTRRFAALLPHLPPEVQAEMLDALTDRGDRTARPAVWEMLKTSETAVRMAALRALGPLGETSDVPLLVRSLGAAEESEKTIAQASLLRLHGPTINAAVVSELPQAAPKVRVALINLLAARRALDCVPGILPASLDADAGVRAAAMNALGQLAGVEHLHDMLKGVLRAAPGEEREAAEKAVMFVCQRIENADKRTGALLAAWSRFSDDDKTALLPALGRVGGRKVMKIVEKAIADKDPRRHDAGVRALCNWSDATVVAALSSQVKTDADAEHRIAALRALIRVAVLSDDRSEVERLDVLKKALGMATRDEERNLVLRRAGAIRTIETLRFVAPYLDRPEFAQAACATVVELARHRELREPNKAEFDKALDAVIRTSKDPAVHDRAERFRKGQT